MFLRYDLTFLKFLPTLFKQILDHPMGSIIFVIKNIKNGYGHHLGFSIRTKTQN
jgi:hypothetical protein